MSKIIENYKAALVDCTILAGECDSFIATGDPNAALKCLMESTAITTKWVENITGLKQVLEERGHMAPISTLAHYLECFDEINKETNKQFTRIDFTGKKTS